MLEIYPGSPFGPNWDKISDPASLAVGALFLILPSGLFALFAVWPIVLFVTQFMLRFEPAASRKLNWFYWIGGGFILGPIALFAYSFPLGLGQALLTNLIITGMMCGGLCAALCRAIIGPKIDDTSISADLETPHKPI
ncbi:hypothetical protein HHL08_01475 [Sphingobium sp. AR-3-1]|uniref:Uncharacterized protein n=1 Tax=Sphingobium psychrophilum TaxID=2728834 RepID=A0A7X9ZQV3_9SPHN|nr:hypothetical protein [Sphingobium psychrophilum]NML08827.1 hypothetical protein [Sphingobium psychrophilum]